MVDLLRNKCSPIALDIGTDSIKMLQLQRAGRTLGVCACGRRRVPESAGQDTKQRNELIVKNVHDMLRNEGFRGQKVITSLSCNQMQIKNVRLPQMPEDELSEAVKWEAKERFNFEVGSDRLKYLNAGEVRSGNETRSEIIMMAVPSETIDEHLEILDALRLKPEQIDAEPVALFRVFERLLRRRSDEQAVSVIVDMGLSATRVVIARGRQIIFIKNIDIGGRKLTDAVAKRLNLSYQEASDLRTELMREQPQPPRQRDEQPSEHAEKKSDSARPEYKEPGSVSRAVFDAVRGEVEALAREIALCLRYCSVTFRGLRIDQLTLTGGEAYDSAVFDLLKEQLDVECAVGQPLKGIDVSTVSLGTDRRRELCEWAVCAGLALRKMRVPVAGDDDEHAEH